MGLFKQYSFFKDLYNDTKVELQLFVKENEKITDEYIQILENIFKYKLDSIQNVENGGINLWKVAPQYIETINNNPDTTNSHTLVY